MNRRNFLLTSGGLVGSALLSSNAHAESSKFALRTISYNILACKGYPETDANRELLQRARHQMVDRLAMELALYKPDIVTFQESPTEEMVVAIADAMGMNYAYFPGGYPGAVITRHEIVESENCPLVEGARPQDLFTRHWGRAVLKVSEQRLTVYSAHLHPRNAEIRAQEVAEALAVMADDISRDQPMLFQGDLNHRPDGPEYNRWRDAGLVDMMDRTGDPSEFTSRSTVRRAAIDYIWANPTLAQHRTDGRVLFEGQFRTNPDDEKSFALSDHVPVMAEFGK